MLHVPNLQLFRESCFFFVFFLILNSQVESDDQSFSVTVVGATQTYKSDGPLPLYIIDN